MKTKQKSGTPAYLRILTAAALVSMGMSGVAHADSARTDATLAITRAEATINLVSKENPATTQDASFAEAQRKLGEARIAANNGQQQSAEWFATEAELLANTTAGVAKLAGLESTRREMARSVDILENELRK